ncbi:uncharacterized protein EI97DRAFT_487791 [Westerdykella ornata]|uniref:Uncharacterized protein n=1 Tax=Westerdykella ornata TaxID=318751 RepID=A0A6A6JS67_WESOR|nr:uncharacterized protein EI97DRAFT_487791 [Westerdykella ornata]KAF2277809.1 hypothetical protein EI97DRAFT_487791 [Westerdykella ornata]
MNSPAANTRSRTRARKEATQHLLAARRDLLTRTLPAAGPPDLSITRKRRMVAGLDGRMRYDGWDLKGERKERGKGVMAPREVRRVRRRRRGMGVDGRGEGIKRGMGVRLGGEGERKWMTGEGVRRRTRASLLWKVQIVVVGEGRGPVTEGREERAKRLLRMEAQSYLMVGYRKVE